MLPLPISANVYWRHTVVAGRVSVYVSQEAKSYKETVGWRCLEARIALYHGPVRLRVEAYICDKRRDLDSVTKVLFDALQGYVYDDDNQIVEYHAVRCKAATRKEGKVIVQIEEVV